MIKVTSEADQVSIAKASEAGQEHIFDGWEELPLDSQRALIRQIEGLDFQLVKHLIHQSFRGKGETIRTLVLKPPKVDGLPDPEVESDRYEEYRRIGEEAIAAGRVGMVMTSSEQTVDSLGEPTGFLPIGPVTGKSLFQLHAEKIRALNRRHKVSLRWWIVTYPDVHDQVCEYFRREGYFGLSSTDTVFLPQPLLPLVDRRGKLLLTARDRIALEPCGHGGALLELLEPEHLEELRSRGIEHLFFFQVDNPLVNIADPVFIGHHIVSQNEVTSKAVPRLHADEDVGVFCRIGKAAGVVEYGELREEDQKRTASDGSLAFNHANTSVHLFSVDFFERMAEDNVRLPFHTFPRTVACLGKRKRFTRPTEPNCLQFRFHLFDALRIASRSSIVQVEREAEFSPVRQSGGEHSPQSAQRDLSRLYTKWLRNAGATFRNGSEDGLIAVEISPLFALDERELSSKIELPLEIDQDLCLGGG